MKYLRSYINYDNEISFNSSSLDRTNKKWLDRSNSLYYNIYDRIEKNLNFQTPSNRNYLVTHILRDSIEGNFSKISASFKAEIEKSADLIADKKEVFNKVTEFLESALLPLNTQNEIVTITPDGTIYCKLLLDETYLVRFEVFIDEVDSFSLEDIDVAITIKEGSEQIFGTLCSLKKLSTILFEQTDRLKITTPDISEDDDINREFVPSFTDLELDTSA
ncbi:MAG: hypothetical protein U5K71_17095 [Gracilimonas sp.]|nr:hypothetical protein [Gracilimonas sp.]